MQFEKNLFFKLLSSKEPLTCLSFTNIGFIDYFSGHLFHYECASNSKTFIFKPNHFNRIYPGNCGLSIGFRCSHDLVVLQNCLRNY